MSASEVSWRLGLYNRGDVRYGYYMNSNRVHEVRFTAKRACIWQNQRWITISRDKAAAMIALGQAVELKEGEWV